MHVILIIVGIVVSTWASLANAQDSTARGDFIKYCVSCHGEIGKGDGPYAKATAIKPADLTTLSARNHGVFPIVRTYNMIDGRGSKMIHGARDMPFWGEVFARDISARAPRDFSPDLVEAMMRNRILELVEYISTLQGK